MNTILWRTIKNKRTAIIAFCVSGAASLMMYIGLFPTLQKQFTSYADLVKAYPEGLMKALNFDVSTITTFEGYLSAEHFGIIWPLIAAFFLVAFAGSAFAGEIERGTIGLVLSQPVSRSRVFWSKVLAALVGHLVFLLFSVVAIAPLAAAFGVSFKADNLLAISLLCFTFGLGIYGIAVFFAVLFSEKGKAYAVTAGILVAMYVLNILSALKPSLEELHYASFFHYFNASKAMVSGTLPVDAIIVFAVVFVIGSLAAWWRFVRRDLAV